MLGSRLDLFQLPASANNDRRIEPIHESYASLTVRDAEQENFSIVIVFLLGLEMLLMCFRASGMIPRCAVESRKFAVKSQAKRTQVRN